jgi:hypothetical protein
VACLRWRGERHIPKNVFFLREEVLIYDAPSLPRVAWLDGRKNVLFLRWRGERVALAGTALFGFSAVMAPRQLKEQAAALFGRFLDLD